MSLTKEQHRNRHQTLHHAFDELLADYLMNTGANLSFPISNLIRWSFRQTVEPDHDELGGSGEDPA